MHACLCAALGRARGLSSTSQDMILSGAIWCGVCALTRVSFLPVVICDFFVQFFGLDHLSANFLPPPTKMSNGTNIIPWPPLILPSACRHITLPPGLCFYHLPSKKSYLASLSSKQEHTHTVTRRRKHQYR